MSTPTDLEKTPRASMAIDGAKDVDAADVKETAVSTSSSTTSPPSADEAAAEAAAAPAAAAGPTRTIHGWKWALVCLSFYLMTFMYGLDTTIAADVQAAVVTTFGEIQQISWLGTGFVLGSVATILLLGNLFERFNVKWVFIGGSLLFEVGSVVCGAAPNMNALIVGRVIAGVGGAGIFNGGLQYFTALTSESERGGYISGLGIFWGVGAVLGPVIGGAFAVSSATWRWAFYINLVIAAVCAPALLFFIPDLHPTQGQTVGARLKSIDWVGAFLNAAVWAFFTVAFTFAGSSWAWNDSRTIALIVVFGVSLIAFVLQQAFAIFTTPSTRHFPVHLLKSRSQVLLFVGTAATATAIFIPIYYLPIYFQFVHGDTAILAAVRLLPFVVVSMAMNMGLGFVLTKVTYYAPLYLVQGLFVVAGGAALYTVTPSTSEANVYGYSILVAIGAGATLQSGYTFAAFKAIKSGHPEIASHTIAFQNFGQIGAGTIALAISGQVFQTYALKYLGEVLAGQGFTTDQIRAVVAGTQSTVFESISPELKTEAIAAITRAIGKSYILVIVAGAMNVVGGALMRWERLFG